jgi:hypothetical protein
MFSHIPFHHIRYTPYVITKNGDIITGRRNRNGKIGLATPHPTLIGGRSPDVTMAGMLHINSEKIASYDAHSGYFKPKNPCLSQI